MYVPQYVSPVKKEKKEVIFYFKKKQKTLLKAVTNQII